MYITDKDNILSDAKIIAYYLFGITKNWGCTNSKSPEKINSIGLDTKIIIQSDSRTTQNKAIPKLQKNLPIDTTQITLVFQTFNQAVLNQDCEALISISSLPMIVIVG